MEKIILGLVFAFGLGLLAGHFLNPAPYRVMGRTAFAQILVPDTRDVRMPQTGASTVDAHGITCCAAPNVCEWVDDDRAQEDLHSGSRGPK